MRHYPPRDNDQGAAAVARRLIALLAAAIVMLFGLAANAADEIRLRREVVAQNAAVKLGDVAELVGDRAEKLRDTTVVVFTSGQAETRVTLEGLRAVLDDAGTNWGIVSLRGHTSCRVRRAVGELTASSPETVASDVHALPAPVASSADAMSNLDGAIDVEAAVSLKALVIDQLAQRTAAAPQDLRVTFAERDEPNLRRSAIVDRFEIEPTSPATLGRVPLTVRRYRGSELLETFGLTADVEQRTLAVVATGTVARGDTFGRDSVEVREVWLRDARQTPIADPRLVVGQTSRVLLRPGTAVLPDHVQQPVLVKRGELVTIRCIAGSLVIRTVGRASEDGGMGQAIHVRNEAARETYLATITGPREAEVRLDAAAAETTQMSGVSQ